jgi:DnaJ-class molecular chaperone
MSEPETIRCPRCHGRGTVTPLRPTEGPVYCPLCHGTCEVPAGYDPDEVADV